MLEFLVGVVMVLVLGCAGFAAWFAWKARQDAARAESNAAALASAVIQTAQSLRTAELPSDARTAITAGERLARTELAHLRGRTRVPGPKPRRAPVRPDLDDEEAWALEVRDAGWSNPRGGDLSDEDLEYARATAKRLEDEGRA